MTRDPAPSERHDEAHGEPAAYKGVGYTVDATRPAEARKQRGPPHVPRYGGGVTSPPQSRPRRLAYGVLTTAVVLTMIEGVCRAFGLADDLAFDFHYFVRHVDGDVEEAYNQEDADLMWAPRPGYSDGALTVSAGGLRGPEDVGPKPLGAVRIACLGDSSTFGVDVRDDETYVAALEALWPSGPRVETLNAGVTGYTSTQALRRYLRDVRPHAPDVVVLYVGVNDGIARFALSDDDILERQPPQAVRSLQNAVLLRSHAYRLLRAGVLGALGREPLPGPPVPRVSLERFNQNVRDLDASVRADGARLVLVAPPVNPERAQGWPLWPTFASYRQAIVDLAAELGAPLVWERRMDEQSRPEGLFLDTVHPNKAGHRLLAAAIGQAIARTEILPLPSALP